METPEQKSKRQSDERSILRVKQLSDWKKYKEETQSKKEALKKLHSQENTDLRIKHSKENRARR